MSLQPGHLRLVPAPPAGGDLVPAVPPPEVREQVGAALERAQDLSAADRELHFETDPETGRVVVQVRDREGNVLRTIPPSEALDIMTGGQAV